MMYKLKLVSFFIITFSFSFLVSSGNANNKPVVSMQLNSSLKQLNKMNPDISKFSDYSTDGIKMINGPFDFEFKYGATNILKFKNVKLVIYKALESKVNYIQIFPLSDNMNTTGMSLSIQELEKKLISAEWRKSSDKRKKNVLGDVGISDIAHYTVNTKYPINGISAYEIVLTTFVDAKIRCKTSDDISVCKNRFFRISVNKNNS